jgi:alpha,alpha-trehalase
VALIEPTDAWMFGYDGFDPGAEALRETLCTLGNGYFATRGAFPGTVADGVHYPGTYVAGCYDRLTSQVAGRDVENESIVNVPNWLFVQVALGDSDWIALGQLEIVSYEQRLDLRRALLVRRLRVRDAQGRTTRLVERRLVHMARQHVAALELSVVAEDWSGVLRVRSGIDGRVRNSGVARYEALASDHLSDTTTHVVEDLVLLRTATRTSRIDIALAARTQLRRDGERVEVPWQLVQEQDRIAQDMQLHLDEGQSVTIDKVVTLHTSREVATFEPGHEALAELSDAGSFVELMESHVLAWRGLWDRFRTQAHADGVMQRTLRLHLFHLLQTVSPNSAAHDVGIPPRGLHGEAYRGSIMWDEIFVLPILDLHLPSLTRAALAYRYHRLPAARRAAREAGHAGAMYPWQSGSNGEEVAQQLHLNPASGRWLPDPTHLQRHIGLAVVYNVWQYHATTGDDAFLEEQGAEILLEVARFFASLASYDPRRGRYTIRGIVGPDEFHTGYPGADRPGLDDNAYTNVMAAWLFRRALELPAVLAGYRWSELTDQLGIGREELDRWEQMSRLLVVPFHDGVISQFAGYGDLEELDWDRLRREHGDLRRLDRILEAQGDTPNRYKVSKQADVLMLFYLHSADELRTLFNHLGYELDPQTITRTVEYYLQRTSHGSTLSAVVHAWVRARSHRAQALEFLEQALAGDVHDVQAGTTAEGIHLGAMAGSVDLLLRCFTGLEVQGRDLYLNPVWPQELGVLEFDLLFRGQPLTLRVDDRTVRVTSAPSRRPAMTVRSPHAKVLLEPGQSVELHH